MVPRVFIAMLTVAALAGCSPVSTRLPTCTTMDAEYQRREAQIQDPYGDSRMGPDTGFRPREFLNQRSEPQIAKDRFGAGLQKQRYGNPYAPPPVPTTQYPDAVNVR